jgi:hypothetical protein
MSQGEAKAVPGGPPPDPRIDAQVAELRELAARHPEPTWEDVKPDWQWVRGEMENGSLFCPDDPDDNYYAAVYQCRIVGTGPDPLQLQIEKAREFGVHPERIVVTYVGLV